MRTMVLVLPIVFLQSRHVHSMFIKSKPPDSILAGVPQVRTVADAFNWFEYYVSVLGNPRDVAAGLAWKLSNIPCISTSFSGIGAPEIGLAMITSYVSKHTGMDTLRFRSTAALDWNQHSRDELLHSNHPPEHLFQDQNEFINANLRKKIMARFDASTILGTELWEALSVPGAIVDRAYCHVCNNWCAWPHADDIHAAGSPCTDFSGMPGAKQGGTMGPSSLALMVWARMVLITSPSVVIHENVPEFEESILHWFFGDVFVITTCILDLCLLAFPCRRRRRISIMLRKSTIPLPSVSWSASFVKRFYRDLVINFTQFLLATAEEQQMLIDEAERTAQKRLGKEGSAILSRDSPDMRDDSDVNKSRFMQLLSVWQVGNVRRYRPSPLELLIRLGALFHFEAPIRNL